jgi:Caspase domain
MDYEFRRFTDQDPPPERGEIHLRPPRRGRRELAVTALSADNVLTAFAHGDEPIQRIVLHKDPTLDDMLAASIVEARLRGDQLPPGLTVYARYAANVRAGFLPSRLSPKESLDGVYKGIRNMPKHAAAANDAADEEPDLDDPETKKQFCGYWQKMAARIFQEAAAGKDPVGTALFANDADFADVLAYLAHDEQVYKLQDVPHGKRWEVLIPNGPAHRLPALVLRGPQSILWKEWARLDPQAPGGDGHPLLIVYERDKPNGWRISLPPEHRLSLKPLADVLQNAERTRNPDGASKFPWYCSADGTMVGAPDTEQGTALREAQLLKIVRRWGRARDWPPRSRWPMFARLGMAAALAIVLTVGLYLLFRPKALFAARARLNGQPAAVHLDEDLDKGEFHARFAGTLRPGTENDVELFAGGPMGLPVKLSIRADGLPAPGIREAKFVRANKENDVVWSRAAPDGQLKGEWRDLGVFLPRGDNVLKLKLTNPTAAELPATFHVDWTLDRTLPRDVFLVAVGVDKIDRTFVDAQVQSLPFAADDATGIVSAFEELAKRKVFNSTTGNQALTAEQANADEFLNRLRDMEGWANRQPERYGLAVVSYSGHGKDDDHGKFYFLPYNYDPKKPLDPGALSWDAVLPYLKGSRCPVLVILDACHSGAAGVASDTADKKPLNDVLSGQLKDLAKATEGVVVLAACRRDQIGREDPGWKHGCLSLAVLEVLQGKHLFNPASATSRLPQQQHPGIVTLKELCSYAEKRVKELTDRQQAVVVQYSPNLRLDYITIAGDPSQDKK